MYIPVPASKQCDLSSERFIKFLKGSIYYKIWFEYYLWLAVNVMT